MLETSARLLKLLSLLQTRKEWSGLELADELEVTTRTLRRDIDRLRDLGYPINGRIGVGGGYQLGAGAEMPPLLLDDDETLAVAVGLQSGAAEPVIGIGEPALRALTKLRQVMPSRLQHRLDALHIEVVQARTATSAIDVDLLTTVSLACHRRERLRFAYRAQDGTQSQRDVEPYRVVRAQSRWYLLAWDPDRQDWRTFRLDRLTPRPPTGPRFVPRELPEGGAAAQVTKGLRRLAHQVQARILVHGPFDQVVARVPADWGTAEATDGDSCLVTLRGESAATIAPWLTMFDLPFTVLDPPELRDECRRLAQQHRVLTQRYTDA
jgi:predicted DNA-binding transcriptional regulator YafY